MNLVSLNNELIVSLDKEDIDCLKYCLRQRTPMKDDTLSSDAKEHLEKRRWNLLVTFSNIVFLETPDG